MWNKNGKSIFQEVNEATIQYFGVVLDPLKPRIAWQVQHVGKNSADSIYDLQTAGSWVYENATSIAALET